MRKNVPAFGIYAITVLAMALGLILAGHTTSDAYPYTSGWSNTPIYGYDPTFLPSGSAVFSVSGDLLTVSLTNTTTQDISANEQVLTALTWDIIGGSSFTLTPVSAVIGPTSNLVGPNATSDTDLSSEWGFKSDITAGGLGPFGVSAVGDVLFGANTFDVNDRFDTSKNLFRNASLNGVEAGIVGLGLFSPNGGFKDPVVKNQMIFTFTGALGLNPDTMITNVQPLFGSDGVPLPEPATMLLFGVGLLGLVGLGRKKFFK